MDGPSLLHHQTRLFLVPPPPSLHIHTHKHYLPTYLSIHCYYSVYYVCANYKNTNFIYIQCICVIFNNDWIVFKIPRIHSPSTQIYFHTNIIKNFSCLSVLLLINIIKSIIEIVNDNRRMLLPSSIAI